MSGVYQLIVNLLYGSELRIRECIRVRVQDADLEMKALTLHASRSSMDRIG